MSRKINWTDSSSHDSEWAEPDLLDVKMHNFPP